MKKVLALALALVMALSMSAMAFAADETTTTTKAAGIVNDCPNCDAAFSDETEYNKHIDLCKGSDPYDEGETELADALLADLTIEDILNMIIDLVKGSMEQWGDIESVVVRLVDFIENIGSAAVGEADVAGAIADLEASLADVKIPGLSDLINSLKAKIKAMYAGEVATTVEATTAAEEIVETGSSATGIAVFAAVSVAAAAAYVCTKKRA